MSQHFEIVGAHRETGEWIHTRIVAPDEATARQIASDTDIIIRTIAPAAANDLAGFFRDNSPEGKLARKRMRVLISDAIINAVVRIVIVLIALAIVLFVVLIGLGYRG